MIVRTRSKTWIEQAMGCSLNTICTILVAIIVSFTDTIYIKYMYAYKINVRGFLDIDSIDALNSQQTFVGFQNWFDLVLQKLVDLLGSTSNK